MSASAKRIIVTHWVGEAWRQYCSAKYKEPRILIIYIIYRLYKTYIDYILIYYIYILTLYIWSLLGAVLFHRQNTSTPSKYINYDAKNMTNALKPFKIITKTLQTIQKTTGSH